LGVEGGGGGEKQKGKGREDLAQINKKKREQFGKDLVKKKQPQHPRKVHKRGKKGKRREKKSGKR